MGRVSVHAAHPDSAAPAQGGSYRRAMTISTVCQRPTLQCGQHRGSSPLTRARKSSAASITDRLWFRRLERRTGGGKPGPLVAAGEQPVVAQALEAGRQHVAQEASDEGVGRQADRTFAAGRVVAHPKAHLARIAAEQAVVRAPRGACSGQGNRAPGRARLAAAS